MTVAVGIHDVVRAQQTSQGSAHAGVIEDPLNLGYARQNVVADVALFLEHVVHFLIDHVVQRSWEICFYRQVTVDDETLHLLVTQQKRLVCHDSRTPRLFVSTGCAAIFTT